MRDRRLPLICLDFDGVLHSYTSGWQGADVVPDLPVPGAIEALAGYTEHFRVAVHSSRSAQPGGLKAMMAWLGYYLVDAYGQEIASVLFDRIEWPTSKPAAFATIDDRAIRFTGKWPSIVGLKAFKPWNHVDEAAVPETERDAALKALRECVHNDDWDYPAEILAGLEARGFTVARSS